MLKSAKARSKVTLAPMPLADHEAAGGAEDAKRSRKEHMNRLRASRLARELADKEAAAAGEKPVRLPQAHRRQC